MANDTGLELRGKTYWLNFKFNKRRIHESARTTIKTEALKILMRRKMELMMEEEEQISLSSEKSNDITFQEAAELAWEDHYQYLKGEGPNVNRHRLDLLIGLIGDIKVSRIDESVFSELERKIPKVPVVSKDGSTRERRSSPATINQFFHVVNGCLKAARKILRAPCRPFTSVKLKVAKAVIRPVTDTEEEKILAWFNSPEAIKFSKTKWTNTDLIEIYHVGISTGMRRGEIFGFTVDQLDGRVITLRPEQHKTGKTTGEKKIVLTQETADLLVARVKRLKLKPEDRMFAYSKNAYTRLWNRMKGNKKVEITGRFTPHSMRHAFATRKITKGASIYHVSKLLGHTSVITTQMYAKVDQSELLKVMDECS